MPDEWVIGCDVGGTFTDIVIISKNGDIFYEKSPTTPHDLIEGILNAIGRVAAKSGSETGDLLAGSRLFSHGTTQTTNTILQRNGAKTGLIITRGFKHTIEIMKSERGVGISEVNRQHMTKVKKQTPLIPLELIEEVNERIDYKGDAVVPVDEKSIREAVASLRDRDVEAIAVCLLWSFKNPVHERAVLDEIHRQLPGVHADISSDVAPTRGEYERCLTTAVNCYVSPVIEKYVTRLKDELSSNGFKHPPLIMTSSGGLVPAGDVARRGVDTLLSGPAGGIVMAGRLGELMGCRNIITADMGGTSFDVGLILDGEPVINRTPLVPESDPYTSRYRILSPAIEIESIGAGGGSIAWVEHGMLYVGPQSAGAAPGPACYGSGGKKPTVTDADVVLGYVNPDYFLGGSMKLEHGLAHGAIDEHVAEPLGLGVIEAASGIYDIINNNMADLIRKMTIERGHDPRDFTLFAFGGASPVHCGGFSTELNVVQTIVPSGLSSVYSALGIAMTDLRYSVVNADYTPSLDAKRMNINFDDMEKRASAVLSRWGVDDDDIQMNRSVDMRYRRQVYDLNVFVPPGKLDSASMEDIGVSFERLYEMNYGRGAAIRDMEVEVTNYRIEAVGGTSLPEIASRVQKRELSDEAKREPREAYFEPFGGMVKTNVFDGEKLDYGNVLNGPAILEYPGTTLVIHPGHVAEVDPYLNAVIRRI